MWICVPVPSTSIMGPMKSNHIPIRFPSVPTKWLVIKKNGYLNISPLQLKNAHVLFPIRFPKGWFSLQKSQDNTEILGPSRTPSDGIKRELLEHSPSFNDIHSYKCPFSSRTFQPLLECYMESMWYRPFQSGNINNAEESLLSGKRFHRCGKRMKTHAFENDRSVHGGISSFLLVSPLTFAAQLSQFIGCN